MIRDKNRKVSKGVVLVFQQIFAVVLMASVFICLSYLSNVGSESDLSTDVDFKDSGSFRRTVYTEVVELARYLSLSDTLERDGVFDESIVVDIKEYYNNNTISNKERATNGIGYRLGDLLNWTKEGVAYESKDIYIFYDSVAQAGEDIASGAAENNSVYSAAKAVDEAGNELDIEAYDAPGSTGDTDEQEETTQEEVLDTLQKKLDSDVPYDTYSVETVVERYAPIGYTSILQYYYNDPSESIENWYYYLSRTLLTIRDDVNEYKRKRDSFTAKNSNLLFYAEDLNTGLVRTNTDYSELQLMETGSYISMDLSDYNINSNVTMSKDVMYELVNEVSDIVGYNYKLIIAVDTDFPVQDVFYNARRSFESWHPWYFGGSIALMISAVGTLLCVVYLTIAAGKKEEGGSVQLNSLDRIKTEIAVAGFLILFSVAMAMMLTEFELLFENLSVKAQLVGVSIFTFVGNTILIIGYLSFVRRVKARTLWSNSIMAVLVRGMQTFVDHSKITRRAAVFYVLYLLVNFFLVTFNVFGFLLALILNAVVGSKIFKDVIGRKKILDGVEEITSGNLEYKIELNDLNGVNYQLAEAINNIGEGLRNAVDASVKNERLKTDLITNVSHDIKTPLTSIINYIGLMRLEDIQNEKIKNYLDVLEMKSQRLKNLTEDLVEASKISSGNIKLEMTNINFVELLQQTTGEFSEKFAARDLELVTNFPDREVVIEADGRRIWRVIENLYNNVAKYAMPGTRVYVDVIVADFRMYFSLKNISENALNINAAELTERFIRGDVSRSTEGSGLGLSIAQNLTKLQNGNFEIYLDGDLFKVIIDFPLVIRRYKQEPLEEESMEAAPEKIASADNTNPILLGEDKVKTAVPKVSGSDDSGSADS